MLTDIETLDIMLGSNRLEREESEFGKSVCRPERPSYNALVSHDVNSHTNSREHEIRVVPEAAKMPDRLTRTVKSIQLSGELNQRITQKMNDFMSSVST